MNSRSIVAICASILVLASLCICGARMYDWYVHDDVEGFSTLDVPPFGSVFHDGGLYGDLIDFPPYGYFPDDYGKYSVDIMLSTLKLEGEQWRQNKVLLLSINKWAKDNKATVLTVNMNAGIGVCDYSGWLESALDPAIVEKLNNGERGIYASDDTFFQSAYVKNGVFLPETAAIPVLGTFSSTDKHLDKLILERKYLYPLTLSSGTTDYKFYVKGGNLNELIELIEEKGSLVIYEKHANSLQWACENLIRKPQLGSLCLDGILVAFMFCFIFTFLMYYRGIFASVKVKHRFGLSKIRLFGQTLLTALAVAAISLLLFGVYLLSDINGIQMSNLDNFIPMLAAGITALSILVSLCGYGMLVFRLNREVK